MRNSKNDQPVLARFHGTEWSNDIGEETTIKLKGVLCIYEASHSSGHFKKVVWKKGVGLIECASGYGAHADGYRLKRLTNR